MRERNLIWSLLLAVIAVLALTVHARIAGQTKPAPSHGTGLPQSVRLYVLDCGITHITNTERFGFKREEVATADLSDPCFLVAHPKGTLIWDTGAVPDAAWNPVGHPVVQHVVLPDSQERDVTVVKSLRAQLAESPIWPSPTTTTITLPTPTSLPLQRGWYAKLNVTPCSPKNLRA